MCVWYTYIYKTNGTENFTIQVHSDNKYIVVTSVQIWSEYDFLVPLGYVLKNINISNL